MWRERCLRRRYDFPQPLQICGRNNPSRTIKLINIEQSNNMFEHTRITPTHAQRTTKTTDTTKPFGEQEIKGGKNYNFYFSDHRHLIKKIVNTIQIN